LAAMLPRRSAYLAADKWRRNPWTGWLLRRLGETIFVARGEADEEAIGGALEVLRRGGCLALSPEGTRSRTGGLLRGKTGVAYLATRAPAPILPVAAFGQEQAARYWVRLRRVPIRVRIGAPIALPPGAPAHDLRRLADQVMVTLAGLLPESYRGVYAGALTGDPDDVREPLSASGGRT
ncbi:MAG TPA: lysophospholipid acyltransferase family protein, partial [Thermoanaerobaculia bacterium]